MALVVSHSVVSCSAAPGTAARQVPLSWNSPGKNPGVGSQSLLQGIFLTQGLNLSLLNCRQTLHSLSHHGSPYHTPSSILSHLLSYLTMLW